MEIHDQERRGPECTGGGGLGTAGSHGGETPAPAAAPRVAPGPERLRGCVIHLHRDGIGDGGALGRSLMRAFLYTLTEIAPQPEAIVMVGDAVRLARAGSETFESLSLMQQQGVQLLLSAQSVGELGEGEEPALGKAVTMNTILDVLLRAEKVITP